MRVQRQVRLDAHEQVLAARDDLANRPSGKVGGGVPRHPQLGPDQFAPSQGAVQQRRSAPDRVALGHAVTISCGWAGDDGWRAHPSGE